MNWTPQQYENYLIKQRGRTKVVASRPCAAQPKCAASKEPLVENESKEKSSERYKVRFLAYRTRLLDADNNIFKYELDALRYLGVLPDDSYQHVKVETEQVKVKTKEEIGTEIFIERIL